MMMSGPRISALRSRTLGIVSLLLMVLTVSALAATTSHSSRRHRNPPPPPPMTGAELEVTLRAVHITPESLAALGIDASATTALVERAREYLEPNIEAFRSAQTQFAEARASVDTLRRAVRSGLGGEDAAASLAQAKATLATRTATRDSVLAAIRSAALGNALSEGQAATLATIAANKPWHVPIPYRCRPGIDETGWVAFRDAYLDQRAADNHGTPTASSSTQALAQWNSHPAVAAAAANSASLLHAVHAAWNTAIRGPD